MLTPQPGIMDIELYQGGASTVAGIDNVVKLSSNENPYGTPDSAKDALRNSVSQLHRYPPTDHIALRTAIADVHGLDMDRIICGVGSDEIISFLCQAYAGPGNEVIHSEHGFAMYRISTLANSATPVEVPERERVIDIDAILAACNDNTRIVFVTNPSNPTGTMLDDGTMARLANELPRHVLLVIDGAYADYVEGYDGGAALVESRDNVVMTRTFSKIYGLGGLRVGWGYGPQEVIDTLNRLRGPFNLSSPALAAAEAAVRDKDWVQKCRDENTRLRRWLIDAIRNHGVECDESEANFVLARFASESWARACDDHLRAQGLIVRQVANYKLPNCLRITVGDESSCRRVAHTIGQFMSAKT